MKKLVFLFLLLLVLDACVGSGKKVEVVKAAAPVINLDSLGMAESIHTFYKWYGETGKGLITKINFVNTEINHPRLDLRILSKYMAEFSKSGAVCTEFIQNETIFYRACELAWLEENSKDVITGFATDRYYCQQGGDAQEFLTAGVSSQIEGDRATVQLLLDPKGPNGGPRNFEMKKENGKWLLSKNECVVTLMH
jgi:hypothetical protein